ncbi:MAG: hypothetical protein GX220_00540 [Treponema sp.]|nr:hypothetical protein [Treponema sp.]
MPVSLKEFIDEKAEFENVDIDEFYDEESISDDFSTDIVVLSNSEKKLINKTFEALKEISPETLEGLTNRLSDLERLAASIANFPSLLQRQTISTEIQTQHTIAESLLKQKDGDKTLHLPTKAILGKGFLVAKYQFFASVTRITKQCAFNEDITKRLSKKTVLIMFTLMTEEVYLSLLEDVTIPIDIRREISYALVILWEHRSDHNVADIAPVLAEVWNARQKLAPVFGTMVGTSELLLLSIEMDDQWRKFISNKLGDKNVSAAMEEFMFGLSYEQIQKLRAMLKEKGIAAIGRDEVSNFLNIKIETYYEADPRSFYLQYSIRRENARARKRMNAEGPHGTLEDYYMRFILEQNREKQRNDIYAK